MAWTDNGGVATTVLIVDDHPSFRASARMLLESEGWEVVGDAEDGERALVAAAQLHPDVVLLDVQLPDLDGFAVSRRLTGSPGGPRGGHDLQPRRRGLRHAGLRQRRAWLHPQVRAVGGGHGGAPLRGLRPALTAIGALAVLTGLAVVALTVTSGFQTLRGLVIAFALLGSWGFVAAGLFAWARRPDSRIGAIMVLTGFVWFIPWLTSADAPLIFSIAAVLNNLFAATLIHLLLTFPGGEMRTRLDRWVVWFSYAFTTLGTLPLYLLTDSQHDCHGCPHLVFQITDSHAVAVVGLPIVNVVGVATLAVVLAIVGRRWRAATPPQRRILGPVYLTGGLVLAMLSLSLTADLLSFQRGVGDTAFLVGATAFVLLPYLFLGGLVRSRVLRAGAVGELVSRLAETPEPGALREALAGALRDPSLSLAYWLPDERRYVDPQGRPVALPERGSGRTVSPVEHDGRRVAAIVHSELSEDDAELIEAVGAAAGLALENERLSAELRARVEELRASRQRIVEAGVAERRRLERDLHDGAQQRLVSLALTLRMARNKLHDDPEASAGMLEQSGVELDHALEELRELARGIHPAVLSDRGLGAALQALASRAPFPVEMQEQLNGDVPDAVESAAYFVVSEALTNAAKYADATRATVVVEQAHGWVLVAVSDDGVGGADPRAGTGLSGLSDRLSALDGRLEVDSAPGRGTTIRARIPCA